MQFRYACLNFKVGSECLLQGIKLAIGLQYELPTCIQPCLLCRGRVSVQQFRDEVVLRMCCGLTLPCLLGFSTGSYYVSTIPKSRFEFLDSFLIFSYTRDDIEHAVVW